MHIEKLAKEFLRVHEGKPSEEDLTQLLMIFSKMVVEETVRYLEKTK